MTETPPVSLDHGLAEAQRILAAGAADRHCAAHSPAVASVGSDGAPDQRVMVLRQCDWRARTLRFHTDARSPKVHDLSAAPVSVLAYEPDEKTQLRISGLARIESDSAAADEAWRESTNFARRCYMADPPPSTSVDAPTSGLPPSVEGREPSEAELADARAHFALLLVEMQRIDWLYLDRQGHRRARYDWSGEQWGGQWLVP